MPDLRKYLFREDFFKDLDRVMDTLESHDSCFRSVIEDRFPDPKEHFRDEDFFNMEDVCADVVDMVLRHSLYLDVCESKVGYIQRLYGDALTRDERSAFVEAKNRITLSRNLYIHHNGRNIITDYYNRLRCMSTNSKNVASAHGLMVHCFGSAYCEPHLPTNFSILQDVLRRAGECAGRKSEAQELIDATPDMRNFWFLCQSDTFDKQDVSQTITEIKVKIEYQEKLLEQTVQDWKLTPARSRTLLDDRNMPRLETTVIDMLSIFAKSSLLLSCYEAELKAVQLRNNFILTHASVTLENSISELLERMTKLRMGYIDTYGASALLSFKSVLRRNGTGRDISDLDELLITRFGLFMHFPGDKRSPAFLKLISFLRYAGSFTKKRAEADVLINALWSEHSS